VRVEKEEKKKKIGRSGVRKSCLFIFVPFIYLFIYLFIYFLDLPYRKRTHFAFASK
jgi:hypothetical protein